jgi:alkylhydroperoxidase family enzyme
VTEITDEMKELLAPPPGIERYVGRNAATPTSKPSEINGVMLHDPELLRQFRTMMPFFMIDGLLSPRDRELAILRLAWLRQLPFVWGEHVVIGKRIGLTADEIERVTQGSTADGWSGHERAVVLATEELVANAMISDQTWAILAKTLTEGQLVELPVLVGQYQTMGFFQNCMRIRLWEGNEGLFMR